MGVCMRERGRKAVSSQVGNDQVQPRSTPRTGGHTEGIPSAISRSSFLTFALFARFGSGAAGAGAEAELEDSAAVAAVQCGGAGFIPAHTPAASAPGSVSSSRARLFLSTAGAAASSSTMSVVATAAATMRAAVTMSGSGRPSPGGGGAFSKIAAATSTEVQQLPPLSVYKVWVLSNATALSVSRGQYRDRPPEAA